MQSGLVREYLKQKKCYRVSLPSYSLETFLFPRLKNALIEENIKREKNSVRIFSSVLLEKIMKTHLKIEIKRLKLCISHGGGIDNYFGTVTFC
jgi:superfamily I DNA and/or RNA helicase